MNSQYPWISATEFDNYVNGDKFVDWMIVSNPKKIKHPLQFLFSKGNAFEDKIISLLEKNIGFSLPKTSTLQTSREYTDDLDVLDMTKTIGLMKAGEKIIYSAYISDNEEKIRGIPDLLVRNDFLKTFFNLDVEEGSSNFGNYYYVPVEIKFSTLVLASDSWTLLNVGRTKIYKMQLFTYCKILQKIQNFMPPNAFIIGKRVKGQEIGQLKLLGRINYCTRDNDVVKLFYDGLGWLRSVKTYGHTWNLSHIFYPNMKVDSPLYNKEKLAIAEEIGEITSIFYCGLKNRENAISQGISSFKDHDCTAIVLGVRQDMISTVDQILKVNRGEYGLYFPSKFSKDTNDWNVFDSEEMYVDFETVRNDMELDMPYDDSCDEFIFLVGVWYKGNYTSFMMDTLSLENEEKVLKNFLEFWKGQGKPRVWYWFAELKMWNRAQQRHPSLENVNWTDLYAVFFSEPFVVKGCYNFKLKSYIKALKKLGLIEVDLSSDICDNGMTAMITAWRFYKENYGSLDCVVDYNKLDCVYLEKLLSFIRGLKD